MPNTKTLPSVKSLNHTTPPSTIYLKGWLNKQKHGKCRAWVKRYFVLYGDELRYYKNKNDTHTLAVISLDHYSLVPDAQPLTSLNQKQWRLNTFCLVSDDETKFDWPDYFLQAEDDKERNAWTECLQKHVTQSKTVLEKWLERLDLPQNQNEMQNTASLYSRTGSDKLTAHLTSTYQQQQLSFDDAIKSNILLPSPQQSLKNHRSVDSLGSFTTKSSEVHINQRHPSDFVPSCSSESSNKLFSSKIFNWGRSKPSSTSLISDTESINVNIQSNSSEMVNTPSASLKPVESPIIHPSEYNHDDDPVHRILSNSISSKNNVHIQTANYYYSKQDIMYNKNAASIV